MAAFLTVFTIIGDSHVRSPSLFSKPKQPRRVAFMKLSDWLMLYSKHFAILSTTTINKTSPMFSHRYPQVSTPALFHLVIASKLAELIAANFIGGLAAFFLVFAFETAIANVRGKKLHRYY